MRLEELYEEWARDAPVDKTELDREAADIPKLHAKWRRIMGEEALHLKMKLNEYERLKHDKWEWYGGTMAREDAEARGWPPNPKRIMRADLDRYVDADEEVVRKGLEIALLREKVDFCEDVVKQVHNRTFAVGHAVKFAIWKAGGG